MRRLLLVVLVAACTATSAAARTAGTATLSWAGWDDQVGAWYQGSPDGFRDGHFRIVVAMPGDTLTAVTLNPLRPDGTVATNEWNTTPLDRRWILGVQRAGVRLNTTDVPVCDQLAPSTGYDLFAEDDGTMTTGRTFRVTLAFASGAQLTAETTVGAVSGGLPAAPRPAPLPSVAGPTEVAACVSSGLGTQGSTTTTTPTTTTPTPAKPRAKKPAPLCKKGQKSTVKKPCRKKK